MIRLREPIFSHTAVCFSGVPGEWADVWRSLWDVWRVPVQRLHYSYWQSQGWKTRWELVCFQAVTWLQRSSHRVPLKNLFNLSFPSFFLEMIVLLSHICLYQMIACFLMSHLTILQVQFSPPKNLNPQNKLFFDKVQIPHWVTGGIIWMKRTFRFYSWKEIISQIVWTADADCFIDGLISKRDVFLLLSDSNAFCVDVVISTFLLCFRYSHYFGQSLSVRRSLSGRCCCPHQGGNRVRGRQKLLSVQTGKDGLHSAACWILCLCVRWSTCGPSVLWMWRVLKPVWWRPTT